MKRTIAILLALAALFTAPHAAAQHDGQYEYRLRNDLLRTETIDDMQALAPRDDLDFPHATVFLLNGQPVSRRQALERIRIWNVLSARRTVCRLRGAGVPGRYRVVYVAFRIDTTCGQPHLDGNVAGYVWCRGRNSQPYIGSYVSRAQYDSVRRLSSERTIAVDRSEWHSLSPGVACYLDGKPVPADLFRWIDGCVVRSMDYYPPDLSVQRYGEAGEHGVLAAETFSGRRPLVFFDGERMPFDRWLRLCAQYRFDYDPRTGQEGNFRYIQPAEAVERFGAAARYGAVDVRTR